MNPMISVLSAIPDGQSISYADFAKAVGPIANSIAFAQPQSLSRQGSVVTIACAGAGTDSSPKGSISHQATVTATVSETATSVTLDNIQGITAHNSDGLGGTVTKVVITPMSNGHFQLTVTVSLGFFSDTINEELDQNGQLV